MDALLLALFPTLHGPNFFLLKISLKGKAWWGRAFFLQSFLA